MAIIADKVDFSNINEVKSGDSITPEHINAPLRASAYAQEIAESVKGVGTNPPNNENANSVGTPKVEIETLADGINKRLKFSNLKGEKGDKGEDGADHSSEIAEIKTEQTEQNAKITRNANRVTALENALVQVGTIVKQNATLVDEVQKTGGNQLDGLTIVDGSYATVKKISGNTVKSNNLINIDEMLNDRLIKNADGSYTITSNGTNFSSRTFNCYLPSGTYTFSVSSCTGSSLLSIKVFTESGDSEFAQITSSSLKSSIATTSPIIGIVLTVDSASGESATFTNLMFNFGSTSLPYKPYFVGLKSSTFKGIKSTGRNLINIDEMLNSRLTENGEVYKYRLESDGSHFTSERFNCFLPSGSYTLSVKRWRGNSQLNLKVFTEDGKSAFAILDYSYHLTGSVIVSSPIIGVILQTGSTAGKWVEFDDLMFNKGGTALPFEPYMNSVVEIPQKLSLGKWDYIENGKVVIQTIFENYDSAKHNKDLGTYNGTTDFVISLDGLQVAYKGTTTYEPISIENEYSVWNNGTEQVITTKDGNGYSPFDYGANTTVENEYIVLLGGNE